MLITDTQLLFYQRCPRRAFLDYYGDFHQQQPPSDFLRKLTQDSLVHQQRLLESLSYHRPQYPYRDWQAGMDATLELMKQGVDRIYRGVLLWQPQDLQQVDITAQLGEITLQSCPDLLVKQPGISQWGNWVYVPVEIKLGKRPKLDYQIAAAFHAYILGAVQGEIPPKAELILRQKGNYAVNLKQRLPQMQQILLEYVEMLARQAEPEIFMARQKCSLCTWYDSCYAIASAENHLSLLPGVTPSRYTRLKTLEVTTVETLAQTSPYQLESYPEFTTEIAQQLTQQAQVKWQNQPRLRPSVSLSYLPENAPVEIYFDIEAQPDLNLDYLHGVLVVDHRNQTEKFYPFLAENETEEEQIWLQFLDLVWSYPISPIYHFCDYETKTVQRLALLYQTPAHLWQPLLKRFVDIHHQVTQTVFLPVESYALKSIARWLGFQWRDPEANGAQSVCWYEQWLKSGDRSRLDAIIQYNEDDCRATYRVKQWLHQFLRQSQT